MLRRNLQQLPAEPTTERKTATFSIVILSKKLLIVQCGFLSIPNPAGSFWGSNTGQTRIWSFYRGVLSGFFSKKCEKCQRFSLLCQSHRLQQWVFKVSTLLQQRPESAIYLSDGNRRPNVTSRCGINSKHLHKPTFFNQFVQHIQSRQLTPTSRSLQAVWIPATIIETYLVIDISYKNVPFFWYWDVTGYF